MLIIVIQRKHCLLNSKGINHSGFDFGNRSLIGVNLKTADLFQTGFTPANMQGINLTESNLKVAKLSIAKLESVNLTNANLMWAALKETNLNNACLRGADFHWAQFKKVDINRIQTGSQKFFPPKTGKVIPLNSKLEQH